MIRRLEAGTSLLIATHNKAKHTEFITLLAPFGISCHSAKDFSLSAPDETGLDFAANAQIKALAAARASGLLALADDSGLTVAAMSGAPGIRSSRFATEAGGYRQAMEAIVLRTRNEPRAAFQAAICLATPTGETATYIGICTGTIASSLRGMYGFGYDPIFIPVGSSKTFAEMSEVEKGAISHRARAFRQFAVAHLASAPY